MTTTHDGIFAGYGSDPVSGAGASTEPVDGDALFAAIRARVEIIEPDVMQAKVVSIDELHAWKPGGDENPDTTPTGWLVYLTRLHRYHDRAERGVGSGNNSNLVRQTVRAAVAAEPIHFRLSSGEQTAVYPKGERALWRIACTTIVLRWATQHVLALHATAQSATRTDDAQALVALQRGSELVSRLQRELAWILTHPGPSLPWKEDGKWDHQPPDTFDGWTTDDFSTLQAAHVRIHLVRLRILQERVAHLADGSDGALQLEQFMGVMSAEHGVPGAELADNWDMGGLFAASILKWESIESARRKHETPTDPEV